MKPQELVERERSVGRIAGILGIGGILLIMLPPILGLGTDFNSAGQDEWLVKMQAFDANRSDILLSQLLQAAGVLLIAAPLSFLLLAAANRSDRVRKPMLGFTIVGPLLLAISLILYFAAFDSVVSTVLEQAPGPDANDFAKNALTNETSYSVFGALQIAGLITMVIAMVYTSLWAMRTGLLTRFLGFLGIGLGALFILIGPIAVAMWTIVVSPLIAGLWIGPRPPAWDAGEAVEIPPGPRRGPPPPPKEEEKADPKEFVTDAEAGDDSADDTDATDADTAADDEATGRPARRDNRRKRKRKQRS